MDNNDTILHAILIIAGVIMFCFVVHTIYRDLKK